MTDDRRARWLGLKPSKPQEKRPKRKRRTLGKSRRTDIRAPKGISDDQLWETLEKNAGLVAQTAEALGVTYGTVWQRANQDAARWDRIIAETRGKVSDVGEAHLINRVRRGEKEAVRDWLRWHAKDRGYTTSTEISGPGGGPIPVAGVDVTIKLVRALPIPEEEA